eukprot:scaffold29700_cov66-Phaeocystis_antarctica.AAC.1
MVCRGAQKLLSTTGADLTHEDTCKRHTAHGVPRRAGARVYHGARRQSARPALHTPTCHGSLCALQPLFNARELSAFIQTFVLKYCYYNERTRARPGRRCGATAQSALGWYRPSVGAPETLD